LFPLYSQEALPPVTFSSTNKASVNDEAEETMRRTRRPRSAPVSYREPTLSSKIRQVGAVVVVVVAVVVRVVVVRVVGMTKSWIAAD